MYDASSYSTPSSVIELVMRQKAELVARSPLTLISTGSKEEWMTLTLPGWTADERARKASMLPWNLLQLACNEYGD